MLYNTYYTLCIYFGKQNPCRLEKVNLKKVYSLAKVIGTLITVMGAMLMTLYKGPIVDILWYSHGAAHHKAAAAASDQHWVTGTIMLLSCIVGWSGFFILQVCIYLFKLFGPIIFYFILKLII